MKLLPLLYKIVSEAKTKYTNNENNPPLKWINIVINRDNFYTLLVLMKEKLYGQEKT